MDAEHAGHALRDRGLDGCNRGAHRVDVVADQRRQKSGGAEASMRDADAANRFDRRGIVEQHAAAAVDLHVDEAGQQHVAAQVVSVVCIANARVVARQDSSDALAIDEHGDIIVETVVEQYATVDECLRHHTVSVTLRRCGGTSGSRPRRADSAFAA